MNQFQTTFNMMNVPIKIVYAEQEHYAKIPDWQRGEIWPLHMKQLLINSILRGAYIPAIVTFRDPEDGALVVLDGQQRLSSVFGFLDGKFTTSKHTRNGIKIIESGRYFNDLSESAKQRILSFALSFAVLQESDEQELRITYRGIQNAKLLKSGDNIRAFKSSAQDVAFMVKEHDFFSSIYNGSKKYNETLYMAYVPILAELGSTFAAYVTTRFELIANGQLDKQVDEMLPAKINEKLFYVTILFDGVKTKAFPSLIPMYQAVQLLLLAGYNLNASSTGCLAKWFEEIADMKVESYQSNHANFAGYLAHFHRRGFQMSFWQKNLVDLSLQPGLVSMPDSQRKISKISDWARNNGNCNKCGQSMNVEQCLTHNCVASLDTAIATIPPTHVLY